MSVTGDTKKNTVLVSGVGAIIGQGIITSLRIGQSPVRIVGLDRNPAAFGARFCDVFYAKACEEHDPAYLPFLQHLFTSEGIDLIIPGIEEDVYFFHDHREVMKAWKPEIVLNTSETIACGRDKWVLFTRLNHYGIPAIPSVLPGSWDECRCVLGDTPWLLKPRCSSGSRGQVKLWDRADFDYWKVKCGADCLVQKIIGADDAEYTVAVFGFGDGSATEPAIFRRRLGQGGATWQAESVLDDLDIQAMVTQLNHAFHPLGPTNYQFRKEHDLAYLLEINPRISASTSLRAALGYNEAWMCIEYYIMQQQPSMSRLAKGHCMRYIADWVEYV